MKQRLQIEETYKKKLLANARAIITNQIALPLGSVKMNKIIIWAGESQAFIGIDLNIFEEYVNKIEGCPVGTERLLWNKEALKDQDKLLDQLTLMYKYRILDKCFEIIDRFEGKLR